MKYQEMIKKVQDYSGLSADESEHGLKTFIKALSRRLTQYERDDFASELPDELQSEAISTPATAPDQTDMSNLVEAIAREDNIDQNKASTVVTAVWKTLKDALTPGQITHLKNQLPQDVAADLS